MVMVAERLKVNPDRRLSVITKKQGVFDWDALVNSLHGKHLLEMWNKPGIGLTGVSLTSIGVLIDVYLSDSQTNARTDFGDL